MKLPPVLYLKENAAPPKVVFPVSRDSGGRKRTKEDNRFSRSLMTDESDD
jgi:hypothetical protein